MYIPFYSIYTLHTCGGVGGGGIGRLLDWLVLSLFSVYHHSKKRNRKMDIGNSSLE